MVSRAVIGCSVANPRVAGVCSMTSARGLKRGGGTALNRKLNFFSLFLFLHYLIYCVGASCSAVDFALPWLQPHGSRLAVYGFEFFEADPVIVGD